MEPLKERPSTIHTDDTLSPKGPWKFLIKAVPGGFSFWGLQLILAWVAFHVLTALSWVAHLKAALGNSSLANYWGELLTARDLWEIMENGKLQDSILGFWTFPLGIAALLWVLWAGWKLQCNTVAVKAGFLPWLAAVPVALLIGYLPLLMLHSSLWNTLAFLGDTGIQFLGWANFFGNPLLHMAFASALLLQWWLCRIDLAHHMPANAKEWLIHIKDSFLRFWAHPIQWGNIVFLGVTLRTSLAFGVLLVAWKWGGHSLTRLWLFFFLQITVAAVNAWVIGWMLRVATLYWKHDLKVRSEIRSPESQVVNE